MQHKTSANQPQPAFSPGALPTCNDVTVQEAYAVYNRGTQMLGIGWFANCPTKQIKNVMFGFSIPALFPRQIYAMATFSARETELVGHLEMPWAISVPDKSWVAFVRFQVAADKSDVGKDCGVELPVQVT